MRFALIPLGNEESYGLLFVGGELERLKQDFKFFDGEEDIIDRIVEYNPDFLCFSPMSTFYVRAWKLASRLNYKLPKAKVIFGGHHAMSNPHIVEEGIQIVVIGSVRGAIERILQGERGLIYSPPTNPDDLPLPSREKCYQDIPRLRNRYRKFMLSMFGCPWDCAYCSSSSSHIREIFGKEIQQNYYLQRRSLDTIIAEAKEIIKNETYEIEWADDDVFFKPEWLPQFVERWQKEINLPIYISTTSLSVLKTDDEILKILQPVVSCVGVGVQAIRPESLKLFNRSWDNEEQMKRAYDRLVSFGYKVNLQCIVGLPVPDPVEDALDTIKGMQRIGGGSIVSCYPLIVYSGTKMDEYYQENNLSLNPECNGDTNSGIPSVKFSPEDTRKLRNICKLATLFVKYNIDERWMRALIEMDFDDSASKELSMARYYDCVVDRLGDTGKKIFEGIIKTMRIRY